MSWLSLPLPYTCFPIPTSSPPPEPPPPPTLEQALPFTTIPDPQDPGKWEELGASPLATYKDPWAERCTTVSFSKISVTYKVDRGLGGHSISQLIQTRRLSLYKK